MAPPTPIFRAPMRARDREVPDFAGARHGVARGLVGTGDALAAVPRTFDAAVSAAAAAHGEKAARVLRRFGELPDGTFVWTRSGEREYRLGCICGAWRYDDSPAAHEVGIHHVRPTRWLGMPLVDDEVPAAVTATFARGGRNLQRTHDAEAERRTAELWASHGSSG